MVSFFSTEYKSLECSGINTQILEKGCGKRIVVYKLWPYSGVRFLDAEWECSPIDERSTTRYMYLLGKSCAWRSKQHSVVSRSSAESEYSAIVDLTRELVWVKDFLPYFCFT